MTAATSLPHEPEFEQARDEVLSTLGPLLEKRPEYKRALEIIEIPERVIQFRVVWETDAGEVRVNTGYRVQFNSALGPYKGGLRLHPTVNLSVLKFLGYEQVYKNALTGLSLGGGKGGSDFDPKGKSDREIRRFCLAFMRELSKHIGADKDVPAGDIGVGGREIGYLFGAYKRQRNEFAGILTGKGGDWGGSLIRPEATGYGLVYYVEEMMKHAQQTTFTGKRVLVSGSGNVAQYASLKVIELGGFVLSLSDSKGSLISNDSRGFTKADIEQIANLKIARRYLVDWYNENADIQQRITYHEGQRPWTLVPEVDVALPSATQNELSGEEAKALVKAGCLYVAEGSNMGCTKDAIDVFEAERLSAKDGHAVWYAPGKASNCGGVAVSGLEMAQNSQRIKWSLEEVDSRLKNIMINCYKNCFDTAVEHVKDGARLPSLVAGANIAGFLKVAEAMRDQGEWW
ncbi:hypothetical protein HDV00_009598 [Rhizophlyctis rosea]|nr:hypothetical protein HDV00_009598 [Rhizophlyctis rosea]